MKKILSLLAPLYMISSSVHAIDNGTDWMYLPSFELTPSARANSMGGAFVGVADDLSAPIVNPAGLQQLDSAMFTASLIYSNLDKKPGKSSSTDNLFFFDDQSNTHLSNVAYATPIFNGMAHVSLYYHQQNLADSYDFLGLIIESNSDVTNRDYGIGLAIPLFDERLSVGMSISYTDIDVNNQVTGSLLNAPTRHSDFSNEVTFRIGALWYASSSLSIGASANFLPEFDYRTDYSIADILLAPGNDDCNIAPDVTVCENHLNLPDSYSIGLAYHINNQWLVSVEEKYIEYSDLLDDFRVIYLYDNSTRDNYDIDNQWQFHIGTEYRTQAIGMPMAFRFGYYNQDYHGITVSGVDAGSLDRLIFDERDDFDHWTFGIGNNITSNFTMDLSFDYADDRYNVLLTTTFSMH